MNETELRTLVVGQDRNNGIVLIATNNGYFVKRYLNELSLEDQLKINNMDKDKFLYTHSSAIITLIIWIS